jgi:hypothetical protein
VENRQSTKNEKDSWLYGVAVAETAHPGSSVPIGLVSETFRSRTPEEAWRQRLINSLIASDVMLAPVVRGTASVLQRFWVLPAAITVASILSSVEEWMGLHRSWLAPCGSFHSVEELIKRSVPANARYRGALEAPPIIFTRKVPGEVW